MNNPCECADPGCPVCQGDCRHEGDVKVYRVDMADEHGAMMCEGCAAGMRGKGVWLVCRDGKGEFRTYRRVPARVSAYRADLLAWWDSFAHQSLHGNLA